MIDSLESTTKNTVPTSAAAATVLDRVTPRAFVFGLVCGLLLCAVGPYNDYFVGATYLSGNYFPIASVAAILMIVLLVNPLLIALKRRPSIFKPSEIITVWTMILVVAGIPSSGMMRYLVPHIVAPLYFASPENGWAATIIPHIPSRLLVTDHDAVKWFFVGMPRGQSIPWGAWLDPMGWWALFVGMMYVVFVSMATIIRKQWSENDHLTFPIVKLPVMLAESPEQGRSIPALLRSKLLWIAVLICTILHTTKGLHLFYPTIPDVPTRLDVGNYITTPPFSYAANVSLIVFPLVIGFSYLLSTEVCLSLWLFFVLGKVQTLVATVNAWDIKGPDAGICMGPAFQSYQEAGGAIMIVIWIVWSMKSHLKDAFAKAAGRGSLDDGNELISYRAAFMALTCGYLGLFLWLTMVASVQPLMAAGVLAGSLVIFTTLAWVVAQSGLLFAQMSFEPSGLVNGMSSVGAFSPSSLVMGSMVEQIGWWDARELMLPSLMNTQQAAGSTRLSLRSLGKALGIAISLAFIVSAASTIWLPYTHGGGTSLSDPFGYMISPQLPFTWTISELHAHATQQGSIFGNLIGGAFLVGCIMLLRNYVAAFPIHPVGFLVAATYPMATLWFSLFLGWLIKVPIMRYFGIRGYNKYMPFFLGLILGDCMNALVWTIVGLVTHTGYRLLPG